MPRARASAAFAAGFCLASLAIAQEPATPPSPPEQPTPPAPVAPEPALLATDLVAGVGGEALPGMIVIVHYTGWLYDAKAASFRGRKFDSSRERGQPFSFPLGEGRVISGWDQGVLGMKVGGLRRLVIPPALGYGSRNIANGLIPPHSTLLFEVELLAVETVTLTEQQ